MVQASPESKNALAHRRQKFVERVVLRFVLRRVVARACPSTVPRTGEDARRVNCYTTTASDGDEPDLVLLGLDGGQVQALKYFNGSYSVPTTLPLDEINPSRLFVKHNYGEDRVVYEGVWAAAVGIWTKWPYVQIHSFRARHAIWQWIFNRRKLRVLSRKLLLKEVVKATHGGVEATGVIDLMSHMHGHYWASHPDWQVYSERLERHLELLVQSGELERWGQNYRPTGLGMKVLDEDGDRNRKHSSNLLVQTLLAVVGMMTIALAVYQWASGK